MVGFSTAQLMWLWVETVCALGWEQKGYQILSQELQEESSLLFNHINHVSLVFRSLLTILIPCLTIVCTSIFSGSNWANVPMVSVRTAARCDAW